jgi:hypothetical protein
MPQVTIRRPFGELDLRDQLRFKPYTVLHLFLGQGPLDSLFLRQVCKRASVDLQSFELARHLPAKLRHKPVPHLGGIEEPVALIITDYQRAFRQLVDPSLAYIGSMNLTLVRGFRDFIQVREMGELTQIRYLPRTKHITAQNHGSRSRIGASSDLAARVGSKYSRRYPIFSPAARRNTTYSWR